MKLGLLWARMGLQVRLTASMGILCSCLLILCAFIMIAEIPFVEESLISENLYYELQSALPSANRGEQIYRLSHPDHVLYTDNAAMQVNGSKAIPERYLNLKEGYSEYEGERSYFVYKLVKDGHSYIVESDQTEFEETESELRLAVIGGCLLMLVTIMASFSWIIKKMLKPVRDLAEEVKKSAESGDYRPLKTVLSHDEIGYLAGTCDRAFKHIYELLANERFFSADLSHELRTRLSVISTSAELMLEKTSDKSMRQSLEHMLKACEDTLRLLRVLLSLARHDHRESADARKITLEAAAKQIYAWHEAEAKKKGVKLEIIQASCCPKLVNSSLLLTVMDNLVRNAIAYTEQGGVEIKINKDGFEVKDTGRGINTRELKAIFDPFYRGRSSIGIHGSGLGLSLSSRICKELGWKLEATSQEGEFSVFIVTI